MIGEYLDRRAGTACSLIVDFFRIGFLWYRINIFMFILDFRLIDLFNHAYHWWHAVRHLKLSLALKVGAWVFQLFLIA